MAQNRPRGQTAESIEAALWRAIHALPNMPDPQSEAFRTLVGDAVDSMHDVLSRPFRLAHATPPPAVGADDGETG